MLFVLGLGHFSKYHIFAIMHYNNVLKYAYLTIEFYLFLDFKRENIFVLSDLFLNRNETQTKFVLLRTNLPDPAAQQGTRQPSRKPTDHRPIRITTKYFVLPAQQVRYPRLTPQGRLNFSRMQRKKFPVYPAAFVVFYINLWFQI